MRNKRVRMSRVAATILAVFLACVAVVWAWNKIYEPPFPVEGVSAKEAVAMLAQSGGEVVEIGEENAYIWYMIKSGGQGIAIADETIKRMVGEMGWTFREKDGAGLFFDKNGETLIATTQMWTRHYVLVKIPGKFKSL